jgi:hypothetical protein
VAKAAEAWSSKTKEVMKNAARVKKRELVVARKRKRRIRKAREGRDIGWSDFGLNAAYTALQNILVDVFTFTFCY